MFKKLLLVLFLLSVPSTCMAQYYYSRPIPRYYGYRPYFYGGDYYPCNHFYYVPTVVPYYGGAIGWDWQAR